MKGLKLISVTFLTQSEAAAYESRLTQELELICEAERAKLPVDMAALYRALHPDLQKTVQLMPSFSSVLGAVAGNELTLAKLIDQYMFQYNKKDQNVINRLKWCADNYRHLKINEMTEDHVRHGINALLTVGSTGKKGVSPQTTNRFKANLSSV